MRRHFLKKFLSAAEQAAESEDLMEFFNSAVDTLQTIVVGLGGALCVWGGINLLEGYGQDNPGSKSQGVKQLVAGGGVALIRFRRRVDKNLSTSKVFFLSASARYL